MGETDNPLKMLIAQFRQVFAAWLLGVEVRVVRPLNVEFPANPSRSDLLFEVIDVAGRLIYLHIELQGRRTHEPMPLRILGYLTQVTRRDIGLPTDQNPPRLESVVIYVGEGAGKGDSGQYQIAGLAGSTLAWRYRPLRLWEMEAEKLFDLGNPAFLALIGQTRMSQPEKVLPQALAAIRSTPDMEKGRLLTSLVSLLPTEEVITMVERLLEESETLLLDTPYLRRMRRIGRDEGVQIGREEGVQIGREEGVQIGREEGREEGLREAILEAVVRRFNPPATDYRELARHLESIKRPDQLQQILMALFDAENTAVILDLVQTLHQEPRAENQ